MKNLSDGQRLAARPIWPASLKCLYTNNLERQARINIQHNLEDFGKFTISDGCFAELVTNVQHYTDRLFQFRTTRPASLRFGSGDFAMIGLPGDPPVFAPIRLRLLPGTTHWNFFRSRFQMVH